MNLQQIRHNDTLREKLASEYVLGTLRGSARRRFERWIDEDTAVRRSVAQWQDRLHPLAEFALPVRPSPHVWHAIENRLDPGRAARRSRRSFWLALRDDLNFWRGLAMVSTALATILLTVLLTKLPEPAPTTSYIATLTDDHAQPAMIITGDARRRQMIVKVVTPQPIAADKSLELWAIPKQGAPRSLGLIASGGAVTLPLPENATPQAVPVLAISLEPKGGSPDPSGPTGPVLFKGAWLQL